MEKLCEKYGCELKNVLTGFKYIGEVILNLEKKGEENRYLFGFEESYGYLSGTYVRDKDAVVAEYGYYLNQTFAFEFEGAAGMQKMADMMEGVRKDIPQEIAGYKTVKVSDYLLKKETDLVTGATADITLPTSNVIAVNLENDNAVIFRPSGTEPKIKLYVTAVGKDKDDALAVCQSLVKSYNRCHGGQRGLPLPRWAVRLLTVSTLDNRHQRRVRKGQLIYPAVYCHNIYH